MLLEMIYIKTDTVSSLPTLASSIRPLRSTIVALRFVMSSSNREICVLRYDVSVMRCLWSVYALNGRRWKGPEIVGGANFFATDKIVTDQ